MNLFNDVVDLGSYLFRIVDNGGRTADRYTVTFSDGDFLALSHDPSSPQGVSQWGEKCDPQGLHDEVESGEAVDLTWGSLPEAIRSHVLFRLNESFRDGLEKAAAAASRDAAEENDGGHGCAGVGVYRVDDAFMVRFEDGPEHDGGPYPDYRTAILATLPTPWSLAGQDLHSGAPGGPFSPEPDADALRAVEELESRRSGSRPGL